MSVINVRKSDVPVYLQGSEFYSSLDLSDDEEVSVPSACLKLTDTVDTVEDLHHLLSTVRFWGVAKCPHSVIDYVLLTAGTVHEACIFQELTEFESELQISFLKSLCNVSTADRIRFVISRDNADFLAYFMERGFVVDESTFSVVCKCNSFQCLQYINGTLEKSWLTEITIYDLLVGGHLRIIAYLYSLGYDMILPYAAVTSSAHGHLNVMKFYLDLRHPDVDTAGVCVAAACHGHIECFKYACEQGLLERDTAAAIITKCCESGYVNIVRYLHQIGEPLNSLHCIRAAARGQLATLQYLHEQGCELTVEVFTQAAREGHLPSLQYLHKHGCPWDHSVVTIAALYNNLACLQYLLDNGCDCDAPTAMANAVKFGALPVLQLLHDHGFPLHVTLCAIAMQNNQFSCLVYLHEQGAEWGDTNTDEAARYGRYTCMVYAHKHGCSWGPNTCMNAATYGHLACLQYAYEHGASWDIAAYKDSSVHRNPACSAYIAEQLAKLIDSVDSAEM